MISGRRVATGESAGRARDADDRDAGIYREAMASAGGSLRPASAAHDRALHAKRDIQVAWIG